MMFHGKIWIYVSLSTCCILLSGCGQGQSVAKPGVSASAPKTAEAGGEIGSVGERPKRREPVKLGDGSETKTAVLDEKAVTESIVTALQPLQILLGKWNGTSQRAGSDQPEWIWDFQSDRRRPALALKS